MKGFWSLWERGLKVKRFSGARVEASHRTKRQGSAAGTECSLRADASRRGLGCMVSGFGFRAQGLGFTVQGASCPD